MKKSGFVYSFVSFISLFLSFSCLWASEPYPWQMNFQKAASPVTQKITAFHDILLIIIGAIAALVCGLLAFIVYRFRASKNPTPLRTSHNVLLEVVWTLLPVVILVGIAIPSWKLIFYLDKTTEPEMTLKVTGKMWLWGYEYPEHEITFDSHMIESQDLHSGQLRLLTVDNQVVIPVDTNIRLLFTATDVLHSWTVPAFGVKKDCVPGRLNEAWVRVEREGTYYGQCSELCGKKHGFMPIVVQAVSKEAFKDWIAENKKDRVS